VFAPEKWFDNEMRRVALEPLTLTCLFAVAAGANLVVAMALAGGRTLPAFGLGLLPLVLVLLAALVASDRSILVLATLAFAIFESPVSANPLPGTGGSIFVADLLLVLAIGSWSAAWLISPREDRPPMLRTAVISWPLLLFGVIAFIATLRGHYLYGTSVLGQALRLALYAGIVFAMSQIDSKKLFNALVVLFYTGAVYWTIQSGYHIATNTSVTSTALLSTGGMRWLSGGAAMYMAGALVLALVNLRVDRNARHRGVHLAVAVLATFCIASAFGRATFAALAVTLPILFLATRGIGSSLTTLLPIFAPFAILLALFVPRAIPDFLPTLQQRVFATTTDDENVRWREEANRAVWRQVEESPVYGVGYGRKASFVIGETYYQITQDPHNSFLFVLAGGGVIAFTAFFIVLGTFVVQALRRIGQTNGVHQALVIWALATWAVFMINSLSGPILTQPSFLLTIWILMLIPAVVRPTEREEIRDGLSGNRAPA
jgi:O-antigen ligase